MNMYLRNTRRYDQEDGAFEEIFVFLAASRLALPYSEPPVRCVSGVNHPGREVYHTLQCGSLGWY